MNEAGSPDCVHLCGATIHSSFRSLAADYGQRCGAAFDEITRAAGVNPMTPRKDTLMSVKTLLGFAAVGGLLVLAAPVERAQALSLINPGAAAAVQDDSRQVTTEVHWRRWGHRRHHHHHRHWRRW